MQLLAEVERLGQVPGGLEAAFALLLETLQTDRLQIGGNLIVDNFLAMNGDNVCPMGRCFAGTFAAPQLGHSVEDAYYGIAPLDVSDLLVGSGVYKFELKDYGYSLGSTEVHLQTNCLLEAASQICHRNFGNKGNRTLSVAESAVAAHLAHGDTAGPCIDE